MARLCGLAVALQTVELLLVRGALREDGTFAWSVLRRDFAGLPAPLSRAFDGLLSYRPFVGLLLVQLVAACALPWLSGALVPGLLLTTTLLVCLRFRGSYNGGSDSMTTVLLSALTLARLATHQPDSPWTRVALGYVAAQLVLSYCLSGLAKLARPSWRRGSALVQLATVRQYHVPVVWQRLLSTLWRSRLAGWLVIAFELSAPLTLVLGLDFACLWLALGCVFHLSIALSIGLNRFFWIWLAAYPALLFWSARL